MKNHSIQQIYKDHLRKLIQFNINKDDKQIDAKFSNKEKARVS